MLLYFLEPVNHIHESVISRDVIGQENAMSTSVENSSNWTEGFLASSVPNLQLDNFLLHLYNKWAKFHSYRDLMLYFELIIHDPG